MKKFVFFVSLSVIVFCACNNSKKNYSEPSIDENTMINIFSDIAKAERMSLENAHSRAERDSIMQSYKQSILQHYKVSSQDYEESMNIYLANPQAMKKLSRHIK